MTDTLLTFSDPNLVPSRLAEVPVCDFSILTVNGGWPENLERFAAALARTGSGEDYKLIAASNASAEVEGRIQRLAGEDAAGHRLVAAPLRLKRHAHREWEVLGDHERERKSRDNFARVLRSWRDRTDLLTGRSGAR